MREFTTAVEQADPEAEAFIEFKVDDTVVTAYKPNDGQFAMFMAMTSRHATDQDQIAGIINFFLGLFDEPSSEFLAAKLLDRKDAFGIVQVQEIMDWLVEEWSARPTQSPSGSTPSPPSTGSGSMPTTPALT